MSMMCAPFITGRGYVFSYEPYTGMRFQSNLGQILRVRSLDPARSVAEVVADLPEGHAEAGQRAFWTAYRVWGPTDTGRLGAQL